MKKTVGNQETYFVYDAFGKLAAEYTTNQTITTEGAKFLTADLVGSPRVATNNLGQVASRHDYMPFGEEIAANVANRNQVAGFTANDRIRQQFTGYERDGESGLDFAQNRYFSARLGRFTSVDPLTASATAKNPQTLNRYSYALNSPYEFVDPLGLEPCGIHGSTSGSATGRTCNQADDHASGSSASPPESRDSARDIPTKPDKGQIGGLMGEIIDILITGGDVDAWLSLPDSVRATQNSQTGGAAQDGGTVTVSATLNSPLAVDRNGYSYVIGTETGVAAADGRCPNYNCMSLGLGITSSWQQPRDGESLDSFAKRNGARPWRLGQRIPRGFTLMKVFQDLNDPDNWHVMRRMAKGNWWSKNGRTPLYVNIKNPDKFYRDIYRPTGRVEMRFYLVPVRPIEICSNPESLKRF